jgi:hypothetical protein
MKNINSELFKKRKIENTKNIYGGYVVETKEGGKDYGIHTDCPSEPGGGGMDICEGDYIRQYTGKYESVSIKIESK